MLKYLGHDIKGHKGLGSRDNFSRIEHKYYPYIPELFTKDEMRSIIQENRYDEPFVTLLLNEYYLKNTSRYDSYLQRVERV